MEVHIFAEGSKTTADNPENPLTEYYQGLFGMVAGLHEELDEVADAELHIISEEFGIGDGSDSFATLRSKRDAPVGFDNMAEMSRTALLDAAEDADVMIILLSTDVFDVAVNEIWDELVDVAKPNSIWCLGAARSSLNSIDSEALEAKGCTVLTYRRKGVARLGTETRDELLDMVRERTTQ